MAEGVEIDHPSLRDDRRRWDGVVQVTVLHCHIPLVGLGYQHTHAFRGLRKIHPMLYNSGPVSLAGEAFWVHALGAHLCRNGLEHRPVLIDTCTRLAYG